MQTDTEMGSAVLKQSYTPIMLQGSNHWKSAVLMDPDYNNTKFSFDKFTEGLIPRILFVRKKFSSEINKAYIQRFYKKRRMISEDDVKLADLEKMFGNHVFKFFYKVLQEYSRNQLDIGDDNRKYLGLDEKEETLAREQIQDGMGAVERSKEPYVFNYTELLEVCYAVLEENNPYFIYEYLQFLMIDARGGLNPFSLLNALYGKTARGTDDLRILSKYYSCTPKDQRILLLRNYDASIYRIKNQLGSLLKFTDREKELQRESMDHLRSFQTLHDATKHHRSMKDYHTLTAKLKLNEVVLPTLMLKVAANCRQVRDQLMKESKGQRAGSNRLSEIMAESQAVKDLGLSQLISHLLEA